MAKNNNPALGGDALEFIESLLTPEEIVESNRRVALISAEIEARGRKIITDEDVECFVAECVEAQRLKGVELPEEYVEAMRRIVRKETTAEDETNKMLAKEFEEDESEVYSKLQEAEREAELTDERYSSKDVLKAMKNESIPIEDVWKELDNEFSILLDEEEARQFKEICAEAGETPESVLVKFAETIVRDEASRAILLTTAGAGERVKVAKKA